MRKEWLFKTTFTKQIFLVISVRHYQFYIYYSHNLKSIHFCGGFSPRLYLFLYKFLQKSSSQAKWKD